MSSLLDQMLAEAEGCLTSADRQELAGSAAASAATLRQQAGDSPLPPPPSHFAQAATESPERTAGAAVRAAPEEGTRATKGVGGESSDDLAAKLAARRQWEASLSSPSAAATTAFEEASERAFATGHLSAPDESVAEAARANIVKQQHRTNDDTDQHWAAPDRDVQATPAAKDNALAAKLAARRKWEATSSPVVENCGALSMRSVGTCAPAGDEDKENYSLQDMQEMQAHLLASSSCKDTSNSNNLSAEEFKEKVDRKIRYFETLARESRLKAQEETQLEHSLQEARSRIEASAAKRKSLRQSISRNDMDQAQHCLGFGSDALSLNDLSDDRILSEDVDPPPTVSLQSMPPVVPTPVPTQSEPPAAETTVDNGAGRRSAVGALLLFTDPKSVFGISPVVEANTPDLSGEVSPCVDYPSPTYHQHRQQQLFWHVQSSVVMHNTQDMQVEASSKEEAKENCTALADTQRLALEEEVRRLEEEVRQLEEEADGEEAVGGAQELMNKDAEEKASTIHARTSPDEQEPRTKTWAGALACATPNHLASQNGAACLSHRKDSQKDLQSVAHAHPGEKCNTALILGKLDTFLDSLRSPYGAIPSTTAHDLSIPSSDLCNYKSDLSIGDDSKEEMPGPGGEKTTDQCGGISEVSEDERKGRAAEKRAIFLASMNRLAGKNDASQVVEADNSRNEMVEALEVRHNRELQSFEMRAQRLSDIASSCDVSFSNTSTNKASVGSSPHHSDLQSDSNSSMNKVSPVLPNSFAGTPGIHNISRSITVVDLAGNSSSANASFGSTPSECSQNTGSERPKIPSKLPTSASDRSTEKACEHASQPEMKIGEGGQRQAEKEQSAGIGIQVKRVRGHITVVDLMPEGPAAQKLKKGQVVLQIDGAGLATLPFKTVLSKFRGTPGSMLVLTVVDSATALKSGQEPQTVVVQRFCVPASVRRTVVALQPQAPESEAPPAVSISPAAQNLTPRSFAAGPRAEQSHDSGLCSPYSDPGDAVSERGKRTISPQQAAAVGSEVGVEMGGTISIDSLHNRLLERLFGGAPIGVATAHSISATTTAVSGSHSTSSQTSSNTAARPSGVMMPVSQQGAGQMNGSSSASNGLIPHTQSGTGVRVDENSPYHQKFRCLVANTAHRPGAGEGTSGGSSGGIYDLPTRITGASTLSIQDKKDSSASRSAEYSKRVRSPNANAALPQNRSDKRMRHDQGTSLGGPLKSFYSTAPSASTTESSDRTLFNRPSRSTGPRKPAIPSFACTASVRSASAPKTRPVLQDRSNSAAHHYTNIHAAPAVAAKRPKERVSVTINANTTSKKNLATSTTSRRNPVRVLDSAPAQNSKAPSPSQARPKTGEKLKTLSPKSSSRASSRTRRFCQTGGGGEGGGDLLQSAVKKQSLDDSLIVYADVGRAVTSLVQKLSKTPDPHRVPNKDEIIEVLGKLTADYTASAAASTATTSQTARLARLRDSSNFNINTSSTHANSMRTPSRVSGAHASRKSRVCHGVVGNNENVENAAVSSLRSGVEGGWGSHEGREKAGAGNRVAGGGELSTKTTFDAVLKSRFGVGVWGENKD